VEYDIKSWESGTDILWLKFDGDSRRMTGCRYLRLGMQMHRTSLCLKYLPEVDICRLGIGKLFWVYM
jgi:hypothetical protein